jgi:hypothetical protein
MGLVDHRDLSAEEEKSEKSDDEQESSKKSDGFDEIELPGSQEEESSREVEVKANELKET